jgi:hypothetical protein
VLKNKTSKKPKFKNIWSIQGLEKRCRELIQASALKEKGGLAKLCQTVNREFSAKFPVGVNLTKKMLITHIDKLIWTKEIDKDLWQAVINKMLPKFQEAYSYIPEHMVIKRANVKKGSTNATSVAQFRAGMGNISTDDLPRGAENYKFPDITYDSPLVVSSAEEGQMSVINGALVGIKYPDIERNTLRRALADARQRGSVAVVLTNIMEIWMKKTAGPLAAFRARVSGIGINPERFPEEYRQEVQDILDGKIMDTLIYQTLEERSNEVLDGLHKVSHRPNGKGPEFPGPVYVVFGLKEEEYVYSTAYYRCRYMSIVTQNKIEAELNIASHKLAQAKNVKNQKDVEHWNNEVARLGRKKARTILTNTGDTQYEFYRRLMRAYLVKRLEETIPNCKVISQGSTYLKVSDKIVKIHIPSYNKITDSLLKDYGDAYGAEVFRDTLADLTVVCHPYSLNHRIVGREDSRDNQPVTKYIAVAPACLDGEFLREEFKDNTKAAHPVQALVFNPQFKPGVLLLSWANGLLNVSSLPIAKLDSDKTIKDNSNFVFPYPDLKYITWFLNTDNHFGASDKRYIWDPKQRMHLGVTEAAIEMMRRLEVMNSTDIRIHGTAEMDDATNGDMWFSPRYRPDPQEMTILHIERWLQQMTADIQLAAEKGDSKLVGQLAEEINRISIAQLYFKGEDFPFHQMMQVYDRHIGPNVDFYSAVLGRFVTSRLNLQGISKLHKNMVDTRDLGVHNFPNGNHRVKTLDQKDLEGDYVARHLQEKLTQLPEWQKYLKSHPDFLQEMVRAPRFGNLTFGWGTLQAPGGYQWGIRVHGTPARQSGWSDILAAVIKSDIARGDDTYGLLKKRVTITFYGDKHFFAKAETEQIVYVMCAAGVHTNVYGSSGGFPPNNTGVCFVSIPADGPDEGPIIVQMLPHDFLRDWFANPKPFDWAKFLPNPV